MSRNPELASTSLANSALSSTYVAGSYGTTALRLLSLAISPQSLPSDFAYSCQTVRRMHHCFSNSRLWCILITDSTEPKHEVRHHIVTTGPPVSAKLRRLPPDKLQAAKREFKQMINLRIIRPSNSCWASPLHLVPKSPVIGVHAVITGHSTPLPSPTDTLFLIFMIFHWDCPGDQSFPRMTLCERTIKFQW
ncbi:unnamed protein product [Dicrocoelium dendriticum]|nr:unnamed protein product [Dicrocoelium dendriticum]